MSDVIKKLLETIGDVSGAAELASYAEQLEKEVTRLRGINDKLINIINTLKNKEK